MFVGSGLGGRGVVHAGLVFAGCVAIGIGCNKNLRPYGDTGAPSSGTGGAAARSDAGAGASIGGDGGYDAGRPVDATMADAALPSDGGIDATQSAPWVLSLVLDGAPWYATIFTQGMAVDASKRVYVGDDTTIYVVDGTSLSTYLTSAEAAGPDADVPQFGDFDIGPDGQLYIVMSADIPYAGHVENIVRSSMPHAAQPWVSLSQVEVPEKLSVIGAGAVALVSRDGLSTFTDAGGKLVYTAGQLASTDDCAWQDLAAAPSGIFLYDPGCSAYPLLRGNADGTGIGVLYDTSIQMPSVIPADEFECIARDPTGGFYVVGSKYGDDGPRLYHIAEDAQGATGLTWIQTAPTLAQAKQSQNELYGFDYCSLAAASDGTVYFQTYHQLWKITPP